MSEETYVMSPDNTGTEVEVIRVICTKCSHYEFIDPSKAAKLDDSWSCPLCTLPDGVTIGVRKLEACSNCGQVYDPKDARCFCPEKTQPTLTFSHDSKELKNPMTKRLEQEIEASKLDSLERKIVYNAKKEDHDRKARVDVNLDKNNIILQMINNITDSQIEDYKKTQQELKKTKEELKHVQEE